MICQAPYVCALSFNPHQNPMKWELLFPIFLDEETKTREVKELVQDHSADYVAEGRFKLRYSCL